MKRIIAAALVTLIAFPAVAISPDRSLRPLARGEIASASLARPKLRTLAEPARPRLRPESEQEQAMGEAAKAQVILASVGSVGMPRSLHPNLRPEGLAQKVMGQRQKRKRELARGAICGDPDLQGDVIGSVPGRINGCGVKNAVKLRSVSGVKLSTAATMDCGTAKALKTWVNKGVKPALVNRGGGVATIKVAAHYACRTRNNQKGAKISEHGKGRAIDISGFTLRNGETISVLKGWRGGDGKALRQMHRAACGPFGTVLGPNADRFHQDHFHFDTARYRSGSYCK